MQMHLQMAGIMTKGLLKDKFVPLPDKLMAWDLDQVSAPNVHPHDNGTNVHSRGSVMEKQSF